MKSKPVVATSDLLISSAIVLMNKFSITSLIIAKQNKPIGIVNIKCLKMINYISKKFIDFIIVVLGVQIFIYFLNQKPLTENFSQKAITVENFSSIVLSKS